MSQIIRCSICGKLIINGQTCIGQHESLTNDELKQLHFLLSKLYKGMTLENGDVYLGGEINTVDNLVLSMVED